MAVIHVKCWAQSLAQSDSRGNRLFVTVTSTSDSPCHTLSLVHTPRPFPYSQQYYVSLCLPCSSWCFRNFWNYFCNYKIITPIEEHIRLHNTHTDVLKNFTFWDTNSLFPTFSRVQELVGQEVSGIWSWPAADHAETDRGRLPVPCVFTVLVCCWSLGSLVS